MAEAIGRRVMVGFGRETTRGTAVAIAKWVPRVEITFQDKATKQTSGEAHGHIDDATDEYITELYAVGNINMEAKVNALGFLLYAALGTLNTTSPDTDIYEHVFTELNSNQHPSLTIGVDDPASAQDRTFALAMLNQMTLKVETGQIVMVEAEFTSKGSATATHSPTVVNDTRFIAHHVSVKLAADVAGLDAASALELKGFSVTINKNVSRDHVVGSVAPQDIFNQQMTVEGEMTLNVTDEVYRALALTDGVYKAVRLSMTNPSVDLGGGVFPSLVIDLPRCSFKDYDAKRPLDEIASQTIKFKGLRDIAGGTNIVDSATLVNGSATY